MIQLNFSNIIKNFNLNVKNSNKIHDKIKYNYIDDKTDWRNLLSDIFHISTNSYKDENNIFEEILQILQTSESLEFYSNLNNTIKLFINKLNPDSIYTRFNITQGNVKGDIDFVIGNNMFMIKPSSTTAMTLVNILESLVFAYGASKKNKLIEHVIIYNPLLGEINRYDINKKIAKDIASLIYKTQ